MKINENPLFLMDFQEFPLVLGKSECHSDVTPHDVCRPTCRHPIDAPGALVGDVPLARRTSGSSRPE